MSSHAISRPQTDLSAQLNQRDVWGWMSLASIKQTKSYAEWQMLIVERGLDEVQRDREMTMLSSGGYWENRWWKCFDFIGHSVTDADAIETCQA
jgi:hypothetical protein